MPLADEGAQRVPHLAHHGRGLQRVALDVADGHEHVLQTAVGGDWADLYSFVPEPVPPVDLETSNWFTATHPRSPFVTGLIVAAHRADGSRAEMSDWDELSYVEETPAERTVTAIERADVPRLLESRFGLPGFTLAANGRVVRAGDE